MVEAPSWFELLVSALGLAAWFVHPTPKSRGRWVRRLDCFDKEAAEAFGKTLSTLRSMPSGKWAYLRWWLLG